MANISQTNVIQDNDQVILRKGKLLKLFQIRGTRPVWIDKAKFSLAGAVAHPYGTTFEVKQGDLVKVDTVSMSTSSLDVSSGQDNRELLDTVENQKLSRDDIEALKDKGVSGQNLVEHIIENSATFKNKTEFSQQKYIKKKKQKHLQIYTILKPCTRLLFQMYYNRGPSKVCYMRLDTLSQILNQGNVHPHCKLMVVESCQGMLLGAMMERMAGTGTIVQLHPGSSGPRQALEGYSFPKEYFKTLHGFPLDRVGSLKIRTALGNDTPVGTESELVSQKQNSENAMECRTSDDNGNGRIEDETNEKMDTDSKNEEREADVDESGNLEEKSVLAESCEGSGKKPKLDEPSDVTSDREERRAQRNRRIMEVQEIIEAGEMDGLIVASKFHPVSIVMKLIDYLVPSRPIVIYCHYKEPLVECYTKLRQRGGVINLRLTETWYREHQVLPSRTHPQITMSGTGGFLLTGLVVTK